MVAKKTIFYKLSRCLEISKNYDFILDSYRKLCESSCEGFVRDFKNPSHAETPLNTGVPEENVRD